MEVVDQDGVQLVTSILKPSSELHSVVPVTTYNNGRKAEDGDVENNDTVFFLKAAKKEYKSLHVYEKFI
jgi:hypothetical protein